MFTVSVEAPGTAPVHFEISHLPCRIGKQVNNDVVLPSWRVARVHAELRQSRVGIRLVDMGSIAGTWINGDRVAEYGPLDESDEIQIAGFKLRIRGDSSISALMSGSDSNNHSTVNRSNLADDMAAVKTSVTKDDRTNYWQRQLQRRLVESIDLRRQDLTALTPDQLRNEVTALIDQLIFQTTELPLEIDRSLLQQRVLDEAIGLGPLEPLLKDASITEIMVNGHEQVFIERAGLLERSALQFSSADALRAIIDRIVSPLGRRIDDSSPMVDARLADGSRVNVVIPPLALNGSTVTIRKFSKQVLTPDSLLEFGSASQTMIRFFELCVEKRKNMVIAGGTGSGKTTLLNVLSNLIPNGERVVTIEDAAELRLAHTHWVSLESRPANAEGRGEVGIRELLRNCLRMRPDRIVIGECRGAEAIDMLQAMNTGHDGSITTIHANNPRDALKRLEAMVMMSGIEMPLQAIREQMVSAIDLVIQQQRLAGGRRVISEVIEIVGIEGPRIQSQTLFKFDKQRNAHVVCGAIPQFFEEIDFGDEDHRLAWVNLFQQTEIA